MFLAIFVFLLGAGAVLGGYAALTYVPGMLKRDELERRLKDVSAPLGDDADELGLIKRHTQGLLPGVDRLVANMRAGSWLAALIEQAGVRTTPSSIMGMSIVAGAAAGLVAAMFTPLCTPASGLAPSEARFPSRICHSADRSACVRSRRCFPRPSTCCPAPCAPDTRFSQRWAWWPTG
jgi:hypothetical protein